MTRRSTRLWGVWLVGVVGVVTTAGLGCQRDADWPSQSASRCEVSSPRPSGLILAGTGGGLALMRALGRAWRAHEDDPPSDAALDGSLDGSSGAKPAVIVPESLGTQAGLRALEDGVLDAALSARPLTQAERARGLRERLIGRTPLAIVAHAGRGARSISRGELIALYQGQEQRWPDGARRVPLRREPGDSGLTILRDVDAQLGQALEQAWPAATVLHTNQAMREAMLEIEGAVGWLDLNTLGDGQRGRLIALALDGVAPTLEALDAGQYPLAQPLYVITRGEPQGALRALLDFARSEAGQDTMRRHGYLPAR